MALINVFRNLDKEEREVIESEDNNRPLYRIVDDISWDNAVIICNGNNVDKNYCPKKDDLISIKQYPQGITAIVTSIVASAYIVTAGVVINETVVKPAIKKKIKNEVQDALQAQNDAIENAKPTGKGFGTTVNLPSIHGASNQNANGKVVPLPIGRSLFTPFSIGGGYTSIDGTDGENQYFNVMFMVGYSDATVKDIRIGGLKVASNGSGDIPVSGFVTIDGNPRFTQGGDNATQIELREGASELSLFPQKVVQQTLDEKLIHTPKQEGINEYTLKLDKFTAINPERVEVEISLPKLLQLNDNNDPVDCSVEIGIAISYDEGATWSAFNQITGSNSYRTVNMSTIDSESTGVIGISTITRNKNKNLRFIASQQLDYNTVKNSTNRTALIRVLRYDAESLSSNVQNTCYLSSIKTWCFDWDKSKKAGAFVKQIPVGERLRNKTIRMGLRIKATDFIKGSLNKITCILESKCPIWDGTQWTTNKFPTSNPASNILNIVTHSMLGGNSYNKNKFDLDKLGELYEFCEEKNIKVNGVLVSQKKIRDVLDDILRNCRSSLILEGNRYSFWIDKPQTIPVTIFNNHNILPEELANIKNFDPLPDAYLVKFIDEENLWQEGQFYLPVKDNVDLSDPATVIETLQLIWCTNYQQAVKYTYYYHASRKLRPEFWKRRQGIEGAIAEIGDLVEVQDDTITVGIGDGGEITDIETNNGAIVSITTDSRFNVADLTQKYAVKLNTGKGTRTDAVVFDSATYTNKIVFETPISLDDLILYHIGDVVSFGIINKVTVPAIVVGKKQNSDQTYDFTLVPYQEGIYTADEGEIPEYDPKTSSTQPIVDIPTIPIDIDKIGQGTNGKDGVGLTAFAEKSALVFYSDSTGKVEESTIFDRIIIEKDGQPIPFIIGKINSPDGLMVSNLGQLVSITSISGTDMAKNGVIKVPILYSDTIDFDLYVNENGEVYSNNGDNYSQLIAKDEIKQFNIYISYAKAEKGQRSPQFKGINNTAPTEDLQKGDYFIDRNDALIKRYTGDSKIVPKARMFRMARQVTIPNWEIVDSDTEPSLYYERVNDLTSVIGGLPEDNKTVKFVNGYFDQLFANTAFINNLFTKNITSTGLFKAENAVINGGIQATSLIFNIKAGEIPFGIVGQRYTRSAPKEPIKMSYNEFVSVAKGSVMCFIELYNTMPSNISIDDGVVVHNRQTIFSFHRKITVNANSSVYLYKIIERLSVGDVLQCICNTPIIEGEASYGYCGLKCTLMTDTPNPTLGILSNLSNYTTPDFYK